MSSHIWALAYLVSHYVMIELTAPLYSGHRAYTESVGFVWGKKPYRPEVGEIDFSES